MKIIAGKLKGKTLKYPTRFAKARARREERLRPTTDKIRGAVFNMIEANFPELLHNASVCDIFSGAGAIGIESLSRGAKDATFIENDRVTIKYLKDNLKGLENKTTIISFNASKSLGYLKSEKFDIIFLDPPYNMHLIEPLIAKIAEHNILKQNGIIIIEHHKKEIFSMPLNMLLYKSKTHRDTVITILVNKERK